MSKLKPTYWSREWLIDKGIVKPAAYFFRLPQSNPERQAYMSKLILSGVDPQVAAQVIPIVRPTIKTASTERNQAYLNEENNRGSH